MSEPIFVETIVKAPMAGAWDAYTRPEHIVHWAFASSDWEAPHAENDLRVGGRFKTRMQAKDKSAGFDFAGTYTAVREHKLIEYDMDDRRHVKVYFEEVPEGIKVTTAFDPEHENTAEKQREGWQAILENYKKYAESM